jgi:creatinine amidohydrolase
VIVPFGSIEDQDGHLPLGADSLLADLVGREVADRLDAVLAPTVRVGYDAQPDALTPAISVPAETLTDTAVALVESLAHQGFRLVVLLSIHGGNLDALRIAEVRANERLTEQGSGARACVLRGDVGPDPGSHSGKWLTSVMLAFRPDLVELSAAGAALEHELRDANAERGREHFERFVAAIVEAAKRLRA